jgi:hypothetical protein
MRGLSILVLASVGLALGQVPAAAKHKRVAHPVRHQAARTEPGSQFQGGVLKGPLYNGQDYLGDDPDPNIRAALIRDRSRYGGPD